MQQSNDNYQYPEGFRKRRGLNWSALGFMYAGYYMCRYNLRLSFDGMREEFGFSTSELSLIWSCWAFAYGTGQLINGLFTDRIGGKRGMLIGAVATILINLAFGFSSMISTFFTICLISLLNGYFQSWGAPGMIKINAAWFQRKERGLFSGIFGGMIQLGKWGINNMGPWILDRKSVV